MKAKSQYRVSNWKEYDKALVNRGKVTLWIDEDISNLWYDNCTDCNRRGRRQVFSDFAIETVLTIKNLFSRP